MCSRGEAVLEVAAVTGEAVVVIAAVVGAVTVLVDPGLRDDSIFNTGVQEEEEVGEESQGAWCW